MLRERLKQFGYQSAEDAIEFILAGICIIPPLLMLSGFVFPGGVALLFLIILLAAVGIFTPPPPPPADNKNEEQTEPLL